MLSSHHTCNVTLLTCLARKYDNLVTQIILHQKVLLISLGTLQMLLLWNWEHIPVLILGPLIITLSLSRSLSFSSTLSIPKHYYLLPYLYYLSLSFLLPSPSYPPNITYIIYLSITLLFTSFISLSPLFLNI